MFLIGVQLVRMYCGSKEDNAVKYLSVQQTLNELLRGGNVKVGKKVPQCRRVSQLYPVQKSYAFATPLLPFFLLSGSSQKPSIKKKGKRG